MNANEGVFLTKAHRHICKGKIEDSLSFVRGGQSIAEQMLYSKEFDPQNQDQEFNHRNTRDYLHVVEDMFKKGKRTKLKY